MRLQWKKRIKTNIWQLELKDILLGYEITEQLWIKNNPKKY